MIAGPFGPGPRRWRGVALIVPFVLMLAFNVLYTHMVQRQTEQKLCRVTGVMMEGVPTPPPEAARRQIEAMVTFRAELDC